MIVFAPSLRTSRRSRKVPSVASVVRVIGTVRISDQPGAWFPASAAQTHQTPVRRPAGTNPGLG